MIVIGYRLSSRRLSGAFTFRADIDNERLRELTVVDPAGQVSDRFLELLTTAPRRVETMRTFAEFADWLPEN